ncbi:MAG: hypothetical protein ACTH2Q_17060 [Propionibacteriaceae bacterium]
MQVLVYVGGLAVLMAWALYLDHRFGRRVRARLVLWSDGRALRALVITVLLYAVLLALAYAVLAWAITVGGRSGVPLVEYVAYVLVLIGLAPPFGAVIPSRTRPIWPLPAKLRAERVALPVARAIGWPASILGSLGFLLLALTPLPVLLP